MKGDIPSHLGIQEVLDEVDNTTDQDQKSQKRKKYHIGSTVLGVPRENTTIETFMKDGQSKLFIYDISKFLCLM